MGKRLDNHHRPRRLGTREAGAPRKRLRWKGVILSTVVNSKTVMDRSYEQHGRNIKFRRVVRLH